MVVKHDSAQVPDDSLRYTFLEVRNVSTTPRDNFEMDHEAMIAIFNEHNVIGVWHSHPSGNPLPSPMDLEWHPRQFDLYIICGLRIHRYVPSISHHQFTKMLLPWHAAARGEREES